MEKYLYGTVPVKTNPIRVLLVKMLNAIGGSVFGELIMSDNATTTVLTTQNTWYPITAGWVADEVNNMVLDAVNGDITVNVSGEYTTLITLSFVSANNANTLQFSLFVNGVQAAEHGATTWIDSNTYPNSVTITGVDHFNAGDVLDVRVRCTTAAAITITVSRANFSLHSLSGGRTPVGMQLLQGDASPVGVVVPSNPGVTNAYFDTSSGIVYWWNVTAQAWQ